MGKNQEKTCEQKLISFFFFQALTIFIGKKIHMRSPKKYLHLYNTQAEQTADYYGSAYEEPWVSFEKQHETVTYNKKPRLVILTSASDSKTYDGERLANSDVTISGEGFKEGDGADFNVTGYQILVGTAENTFTYTLNTGTKADDYDIRTVFGTLEVVDGTGEDEEPVDPEFVVKMEADDDTYHLNDTVIFSITANNIYDSSETIYLQTNDGVTLAQSTFENVAGGDYVSTEATHTITEADIIAGEFTASVTANVGNVQAEADETVSTQPQS